jgi:hypothetical protein
VKYNTFEEGSKEGEVEVEEVEEEVIVVDVQEMDRGVVLGEARTAHFFTPTPKRAKVMRSTP